MSNEFSFDYQSFQNLSPLFKVFLKTILINTLKTTSNEFFREQANDECKIFCFFLFF